ncbi:MAG: hypothetical protein FWE47_02615 [Oscillospiraceae bacterium]|nr:hypothetical protein [Oscillospiraceae bacterium]
MKEFKNLRAYFSSLKKTRLLKIIMKHEKEVNKPTEKEETKSPLNTAAYKPNDLVELYNKIK